MQFSNLSIDMYNEISRYFNIHDVGRMRQTCTCWRQLLNPGNYVSNVDMLRRQRIQALRNNNPFMEMVLKQRATIHKWSEISMCQYIIFDYIFKYPTIPWDYSALSANPNITIEHAIEYNNLQWNWDSLTKNPNTTLNDVLKRPHLQWNWYYVSKDILHDITIVDKYPSLPWNNHGIYANYKITIRDCLERPHINGKYHEICQLSANMEDLHDFPNYPWKWTFISASKHITIQELIKYKDLPWDWNELANNDSFDSEIILSHPELPWGEVMSYYCNNLDFIKSNPHINWNWDDISSFIRIPFDNLVANKHLPWNYECLMANSSIKFDYTRRDEFPHISISRMSRDVTIEYILDHPKLPWDIYEIMFNNNNVTCGHILAHPEIFGAPDYAKLSEKATIADVLSAPNGDWSFPVLSCNNVTFEDMCKYPEFPWDVNYFVYLL